MEAKKSPMERIKEAREKRNKPKEEIKTTTKSKKDKE